MAKEEPTIREQEYINEWYGKKKAKEMAEDLGICLNRVYNICQFLGKKHLNPNLELNKRQKQVILSGILGDGNIKRNGRNYYYRESHALKEKKNIVIKGSVKLMALAVRYKLQY